MGDHDFLDRKKRVVLALFLLEESQISLFLPNLRMPSVLRYHQGKVRFPLIRLCLCFSFSCPGIVPGSFLRSSFVFFLRREKLKQGPLGFAYDIHILALFRLVAHVANGYVGSP